MDVMDPLLRAAAAPESEEVEEALPEGVPPPSSARAKAAPAAQPSPQRPSAGLAAFREPVPDSAEAAVPPARAASAAVASSPLPAELLEQVRQQLGLQVAEPRQIVAEAMQQLALEEPAGADDVIRLRLICDELELDTPAAGSSESEAEDEEEEEEGDEGSDSDGSDYSQDAPQPRELLLMVAANEYDGHFVPYAQKLRVQARDLSELCDAVASGLDIDEPVAVTLYAASLSDAAPLSDLAELPDKSKVSVWPARCFGGASTLEDSDDDDAVAGCDKSWTEMNAGEQAAVVCLGAIDRLYSRLSLAF